MSQYEIYEYSKKKREWFTSLEIKQWFDTDNIETGVSSIQAGLNKLYRSNILERKRGYIISTGSKPQPLRVFYYRLRKGDEK